jgi:ribokinase
VLTHSVLARLSVLVVGALNMDHILYADQQPEDDGSAWLSSVTDSVGGHAGNCATALARLGARVSVLGAAGQDADGEAIVESLQAVGVTVRHVRRVAGPSGRAFIPVFHDRRFMLLDRAANDMLRPADLVGARPFGYDAVVVFDPPKAVLDQLQALRAEGRSRALLCWTPGGQYASAACRPFALDTFDLILANRSEYRQMFGSGPPDRREIRAGQEIAMTLGASGSRLYSTKETVEMPALRVDAEDSTGAGDAFCAALTLARLAGEPPARRLAFANVVGALATCGRGARGSLPTFDEAVSGWRRYGPAESETVP